MLTKVKKAITLSCEDDKRLQVIKQATGKAYSQLIQDAVQHYLRDQEMMLMEQHYASYYGNSKNKEREQVLSEEMWNLSRESMTE